MSCSRYACSLLAVLLAACSASTFARTVLVQTTSRSALGNSAGIFVQVVNLGTGSAVPGAQRLPGAITLQPTRYATNGLFGFTTLAPRGAGVTRTSPGRNIVSTFQASPLRLISNSLLTRKRGWQITTALLLPNPTRRSILLLEQAERPGEDPPGRLSVLTGDFHTGNFGQAEIAPWLLDGIPIDACVLPDRESIAVLCQEPAAAGTFLHVRNTATGDIIRDRVELHQGERQYGSTAVALTLSEDGSRLIALTTGYEIGQSGGSATSWLHILSTASFNETAPSTPLPGTTRFEEQPLTPGNDNSLWIATQSPGTGFGHATHVLLDGESPEIAAQIPFTGLRQPLLIVPRPSARAVAVAAGTRLEVWPEGRPADTTRSFDAPIGALKWFSQDLLLGEGGRLHVLDSTTLASRKTVQLQTGHVSEIHVLPEPDDPDVDGDGLSVEAETARNTSPTSPDTDRDGIADGVDPEPTLHSPSLSLPASVMLRRESGGAEVVTFTQDAQGASAWNAQYDRREMRWMDLNLIDSSIQAKRMTLALNPATYASTEDEWLSGVVTVELGGSQLLSRAAGSPSRFVVDVAPSNGGIRRVLWVWPEDEKPESPPQVNSSERYTDLLEMLAGPPDHVSHHNISGPIGDSVDAYDLIVITMEAAVKGVLTRQVALDYVAHGGSLLFLGAHVPEDTSDAVARWLEPVGITLDPTLEVTGAFMRSGGHEISRNWDSFKIRAGCTVLADEDVTVAVPGNFVAHTAIVAQRRFGFGRIAVLASGTPLQNDALPEQKHTRFAHDLFDWLLSSRHAVQDQDADGLPDHVEDVNGNGVPDDGETSLINPDSDHDGIPDSLEDLNGNGLVNEGETNPRNADSDGDGIRDGADALPLPPSGRPQITSIEPLSGPAEGGTVVELTGLNFTPNLSVWFGKKRSRRVKTGVSNTLIAIAPGDTQDEVGVRLVDAVRGTEITFPSNFRYTNRSDVRLALNSFRLARRQYQTYAGALAIMMDAPNIQVADVAFNFGVSPNGTVDQCRVIPSPQLSAAQRQIFIRRLNPSLFRITLSDGLPLTGHINLGTIQWNTVSDPRWTQVEFIIRNPLVAVELGGTAAVHTDILGVDLLQREARAAPR